MAKLVNRDVIMLKVESTYNVDPTLDPLVDSILVESLTVASEGLKFIERNSIQPALNTPPSTFSTMLRKVDFDVMVAGSGTLGTPPEIGQALRGCAFSETINASTDVQYTRVSNNLESVYIQYEMDGIQYIISGARGTVSMEHVAQDSIVYSFSFTGHTFAPIDSALPTPAYDNTLPQPIFCNLLTVNGSPFDASTVSIEIGNTIVTPPSLNSCDGFGEILITNPSLITGSIDFDATPIAVNAFEQDMRDSMQQAIVFGDIGTIPGNMVSYSIPNAQWTTTEPGDRSSLRTYDVAFKSNDTVGDDAITITFK